MAKVAGEISRACQLQDHRTVSNNSQEFVCETSCGLPGEVDGIEERDP